MQLSCGHGRSSAALASDRVTSGFLRPDRGFSNRFVTFVFFVVD